MGGSASHESDAPEAARLLRSSLGDPDLGVVLGSGFAPLAGHLGCGDPVPGADVAGMPKGSVRGHGGGVSAARRGGSTVWVVIGRLHLYEGLDAASTAWPITLLAAAGARAVLLTSAAGGLEASDRPGDWVVVADHLNLMGDDPIRRIPPALRDPAFVDLQEAYDPALRGAWREAAEKCGIGLRDGVLAAVPGPCYETPAEVRMLRTLGADLVSMSTVPEVLEARYRRLRVAALACVANRGAGMGGGAIDHDGVLEVVARSVLSDREFLLAGIDAMLGRI
jgi:purine-nucleoside phosphorylase